MPRRGTITELDASLTRRSHAFHRYLWRLEEQSPGAQEAYLEALGGLLEGRDVPLVDWLFLHAMVDPGDSSTDWQVFGSVSIRDSAGAERPVYEAWGSFDL